MSIIINHFAIQASPLAKGCRLYRHLIDLDVKVILHSTINKKLKIRTIECTLSPGVFSFMGGKYKIYSMKNMSRILKNISILLAHMKAVVGGIETHSYRLGKWLGQSDDYRKCSLSFVICFFCFFLLKFNLSW